MRFKSSVLVLAFILNAFYEVFGASYSGTISNFNVTRTSGCSALAISFSKITLTITSKTTAKVKFDYKFVSNVVVSTKELTGKITNNGTSIVIDFGNIAATSTLCSPNAVTVNLKFYGGAFGSVNISGYLEASVTGAYVGKGKSTPNSVLPYIQVASPKAVVEKLVGSSICSNSNIDIKFTGDNYQAIYLLIDDQRVGTPVTTDDFFSVNKGFFSNSIINLNKLFPTTISATDGVLHTIKLEINGVKTTVTSFRSYNALSNVQLTASKTISCYGAPITLSVNSTGVNYAWSEGGSTAATYTVNTPTTKKYFVTLSKGPNKVCPFKTNEVSIQAFPNFSAVITPDKVQTCTGLPIQLKITPNDAAQYNFKWSNGATSSSIAVTQTGSYKATITPKNGCAAKESNIVSNLKFDAAIVTANVSPATLICNKTVGANLQATTEAGVGIKWNTGSASSTINVKTAGTYTATFTRGTCTLSKTVSVKEEALKVSITHATTASSIIVCSGVNYQAYGFVASSNFSGATIRWKLNNEATNAGGTNTGSKYNPTVAGTFYAIAESTSLGCKSVLSNPIKVSLIPNFSVGLTPLNPAAICDGLSTTIAAKPTYTSSLIGYTWQQDAQVLTTKTASITANTEAKYTVTAQQEGCKATATTQLTFKVSKPTIAVVDNTKLTASLSTDGYEWYFKDLPASTNFALYKPIVPAQTSQEINASKVGSYTVRASRNNCTKTFASSVEIAVLTAQEDTDLNLLSVYPNPTTRNIIIELNSDGLLQNNLIEIYNSTGILIENWQQNEKIKEYSLENLSSGIYFLIFNQKDKKISKRILKL